MKYPVETLTTPEIQRLLQACNRGRTGKRNRALLVLLWRSGLRISEALALRPCDVSPTTATVLHGKGDKHRTVALDPHTVAALQPWLAVRPPSQHVFCTLAGRNLSTSYVRGLFKRLGRIAGVEKRVHPHQMRHQYATELLSEGVPLNIISRQLGHSSVATTSRYLSHVASNEVVAMAQARACPIAV